MTPTSAFCIPGPWSDRAELIKSIVTVTKGEYLFAGEFIANADRKEHYELDFCHTAPEMLEAFKYAGQGKITDETLGKIAEHKSVVYLISPLHILEEQDKLNRFLEVLRLAGGFAVKVESSGIAHEWDRWTECVSSELPFDIYRGFTQLVGDTDCYYSCGMHHFNLPDVEVPSTLSLEQGAELINQFNLYQFIEEPQLQEGHTFSFSEDTPKYRVNNKKDTRHAPDDLFHNPRGLWRLSEVKPDEIQDMNEDSPVVYAESDDQEMQQAFQDAQQAFQLFWRELSWERQRIIPALDLAVVKLPFSDGEEEAPTEVEHMWITDIDFDGENISGTLMNSPNQLRTLKEGDQVSAKIEKLEDCMMTSDSKAYGAYTVNLMRKRMSARERKEHDQAWGLDFGSPDQGRPLTQLYSGKQGIKYSDGKDTHTDHPMCSNSLVSIKSQVEENDDLLNFRDDKGWNLLHINACAGNLGVTKILIEHGFDVSAQTGNGKTPIELAKKQGWPVITSLLKGSSLTELERGPEKKESTQDFCSQCGRNTNLSSNKSPWHGMNFCNTACLETYQKDKGISKKRSSPLATKKKTGFFRKFFGY